MKRTVLFIICFTSFIQFTLGQSLDRLDNNNGFRKFKFGMSPTQIKDLTKTESIRPLKDVVNYKYTGDDINNLYSVKTDKITLSFYKNKLFSIMIGLGSIYRKYEDFEYEIIQKALKANFGSQYHNCEDQKDMLNCAIWDAKKVRCEHIRMNLSEADGSRSKDFNYISGYILFIFKPLDVAQQQEEF